ncbi:MAG TPA: phosphate ABC transporter, permease protein PstA, partial [Acidocella sp.]|nr:phosphate ABC transporter, permease protein PstA [Acidocella sp.]
MSASVSNPSFHSDSSALALRRTIVSTAGWIACGIGLVLIIFPLLDIVGVVAFNGIAAINW